MKSFCTQNNKRKESRERRREDRLARQAEFENVALLNVHNTERQCLVQRDGETGKERKKWK